MAGMRPDEARKFYEEDEEPAKVFAIFDAAERGGRLQRTAPPKPRPELVPLRELLGELLRDLRQFRLRDRAGRALRHLADTIESHSKAH
jgi:hypothetical protein